VLVANEQRSALDTFLSAATAANFNIETHGVREVGDAFFCNCFEDMIFIKSNK
jgi:hypothetical protein